MRRQAGFTLLELMTSIVILGIVSGMLFVLAGSLNGAALAQEAKIASQDEARAATDFVVRELRQAAGATIPSTLPGSSVSYRIAADMDGNGTAVDALGNLELSPVHTLQRDLGDLNRDGRTVDQLVMVTGQTARVVTNGLAVNEDTNANGALDAGEDLNANGVLERGIWFERVGRGLRVTIQTQRRAGPGGLRMTSTLAETVMPRN